MAASVIPISLSNTVQTLKMFVQTLKMFHHGPDLFIFTFLNTKLLKYVQSWYRMHNC